MAPSTCKKGEDLIDKYFDSQGCRLFSRPIRSNPDYQIVFAKRESDYVVVTSRGEEFSLLPESLDKVRDILSGNMTGLTDYELKFFKKFNYENLLKSMAEESMYRYLEKEGKQPDGEDMLLLNMLLNPQLMSPLREEPTEEEVKIIAKRKEKIEKYVEDTFGVKVEADESTFTKALEKLASDQATERKKFMKDLKKR
ncbi:MAG: hypothetical protein V1678_02265 [Candidatus Aenigmatarchaeota archaeon]